MSGQNRVGFDYSAISRGNRHDYDDDDDDDDDEDVNDAADFSVEPPAGYKHKVKPHLESDALSDLEDDVPRASPAHQQNAASGSATPQRTLSAPSNQASISKPRFTQRSNAPAHFPEFHTSRGAAGGAKFRPPEETEDSRYLAGIPGLRRPERRRANEPRFGDPADKAQSPFRVPVAFVKATGEYGDPLKGNLPPSDPDNADPAAQQQLTDTRQQSSGDPSATKHAGLGFSKPSSKPSIQGSTNSADTPAPISQTSATPYTPPRAVPAFPDTSAVGFDFDHDAIMNGDDEDEVNALLAAFPGSKQLAPGESMLEDDEAVSWTLPAFQPEAPNTTTTTPLAAEHPTFSVAETKTTTPKAASRISTSSSDEDEEIILVPSQTYATHSSATRASPLAQPISEAAKVSAPVTEGEAEVEVVEEADLGFVIDLEGEDPSIAAEHIHLSGTTSSTHRPVLGDAASSAAKSSRKPKAPKRGKPRRIPREGDSDLDWGSDGPPGVSDDGTAEEEDLATAAASISITNSATETITDPILAKAIRADRHEWESSDDDHDISMGIAKPSKRRGGQRAKRSLAGKAAASRTAAQLARSRKADQDAILADYMQNIMNQGDDSSDEDQDAAKQGLFSTDDMVVETINGDLPADVPGKGKGRARRLSNKLDDKTDLDAMIQFMNGMDPQKGGRQLGFGDIEDEIHMGEVKEWLTESEDDSDDEADAGESKAVLVEVDDHSLQAKPSKDAEVDSDEDEDLAEQLRIILEDDDDDESSEIFSEDSDSEDDDGCGGRSDRRHRSHGECCGEEYDADADDEHGLVRLAERTDRPFAQRRRDTVDRGLGETGGGSRNENEGTKQQEFHRGCRKT